MRTWQILTALLLLFLTPLHSSSQRRRSPPRPQPPAPKFDTAPFDLSIERLPPNYLGHSLFTLAAVLPSWERVSQKSEFETTDEYQARLAKLKQKPLAGALYFHSLQAFMISSRENGQLTASYDADLGVMSVTLKLRYDTGLFRDLNDRHFTLQWAETSNRVGAYVGRTAFNRSARVQVYRNEDFMLRMPSSALDSFTEVRPKREDRIYDSRYELTCDFSFNMGATEARAAKPNLRALVIGYLAEKQPYRHQSDRDEPEITDPYDRYNHEYWITIVPREIWIYDFASGLVYAQAKALKDEPASQPRASNNSSDYDRVFSDREVSQKARILSRPEPQYTEEARKNQVSGRVVLNAVFSSSGQVTNIRVVEGLPYGLSEKAMAAARQIRFAPAMKDGRAVSQYIQIEYNFNLY